MLLAVRSLRKTVLDVLQKAPKETASSGSTPRRVRSIEVESTHPSPGTQIAILLLWQLLGTLRLRIDGRRIR